MKEVKKEQAAILTVVGRFLSIFSLAGLTLLFGCQGQPSTKTPAAPSSTTEQHPH
jgi:uncharacterized lipoprotein YajG